MDVCMKCGISTWGCSVVSGVMDEKNTLTWCGHGEKMDKELVKKFHVSEGEGGDW